MQAAWSSSQQLPEPLAGIAAEAEQEAAHAAAGFRWDPVRGLRASSSIKLEVDSRPLNVLMTKGGKSLFSSLQDERVRTVWPGQKVSDAPDIVVTTEPDRLAQRPPALDLSDDVWNRLRSGATKLVIDSSGEGHPYDVERFSRIERSLEALGVSASDCIYVTQHRGFRGDYVAHRRTGGAEEPRLGILVHDRYIQYLFAAFRDSGDDAYRHRLATYASAKPVRKRRFISLNNKFRPARMLFLLGLLRDGLWDRGYISLGDIHTFSGHPLSRSTMIKRFKALTELGPIWQELAHLFDKMIEYPPRYLGFVDAAPKKGADRAMIVPQMFAEYTDSWFSIILETDFSNRLHRITEKPFKPLLCFHPLLLLGSCGSLHLIRQYGFETFPSLFDESYDQEADGRMRFEMVYQQAARLCRLDESELARRCEAATRAVVFNACWGLTRMPRLFRDRIDAALVDRFLAFARRPATRLDLI